MRVIESSLPTPVLRSGALFALLFLHGCTIITGGGCATMGHFGVIATVIDTKTKQVPAVQTKITLRDGSYMQVIAAPNLGPGVYGGAEDREGVYSLTAEATGYQTFVQNGIVVNARSCGEVNTNNVTIQLATSG